MYRNVQSSFFGKIFQSLNNTYKTFMIFRLIIEKQVQLKNSGIRVCP